MSAAIHKGVSEPAPAGTTARRWRTAIATVGYRLVASPRSVTGTVLLAYGVWISVILGLSGSPYAFVNPGRYYIQLAGRHGIALPPLAVHYGGTAANPHVHGYDGQFTYYIALHPGSATHLLDVPWYRYQRILEPLLVNVFAVGVPALIPWLMLAVSWIAVAVGTWAIASLLSAIGRRPGWALLFGFWPGLLVTVRNDITDGLAYGLVAVALLLLASPTRSRPALSAMIISLAIFARQEVAIYAAMMAFGIAVGLFPRPGILESRPRRDRLAMALRFAAIAVGPFCAYLVFLSIRLRTAPSQISTPISVPKPEMLADVLLLLLPTIVSLWAFLPSNFRWRSKAVWAWATYGAHVVALTGFMLVGQLGVYYSWSFSTVFLASLLIPVALGALLCYGFVEQLSRVRIGALLVCLGLSMVAFPILAITGF